MVICVVVAIYISLRIQYTINKADDFIERCGKLMGSVMTNRCCVVVYVMSSYIILDHNENNTEHITMIQPHKDYNIIESAHVL